MIDSQKGQCYDSPMSLEKIEKLSFLVTSVVEELNELKMENRRLHEQVREMDRRYQAMANQNQKSLSQLARLNALESSNRKLENDKSVIRSRIQAILENLEKLNFA